MLRNPFVGNILRGKSISITPCVNHIQVRQFCFWETAGAKYHNPPKNTRPVETRSSQMMGAVRSLEDLRFRSRRGRTRALTNATATPALELKVPLGHQLPVDEFGMDEEGVYRGPANHHERRFRWGVGNKFRAANSNNRYSPVHHERVMTRSVANDYYTSPESHIVWEDLNEQWEVYWYEHGKWNARPFPVKKFGVQAAKNEALAFSEALRSEGRLLTKAVLPESGVEGISWDEKMNAWNCLAWDPQGRPICRSFSAEVHGLDQSLFLAKKFRNNALRRSEMDSLALETFRADVEELKKQVSNERARLLQEREQNTIDILKQEIMQEELKKLEKMTERPPSYGIPPRAFY